MTKKPKEEKEMFPDDLLPNEQEQTERRGLLVVGPPLNREQFEAAFGGPSPLVPVCFEMVHSDGSVTVTIV
jgi:hypothetical protein